MLYDITHANTNWPKSLRWALLNIITFGMRRKTDEKNVLCSESMSLAVGTKINKEQMISKVGPLSIFLHKSHKYRPPSPCSRSWLVLNLVSYLDLFNICWHISIEYLRRSIVPLYDYSRLCSKFGLAKLLLKISGPRHNLSNEWITHSNLTIY